MKKIYTLLVFAITVVNANAQSIQWAKHIGGTGDANGNAITIDANQNVITTGSFIGTTDFDPGSGTFNLIPIGDTTVNKMFVQKLDSAGNFVWAVQIGGLYSDVKGVSVTTDAAGNIYLLGSSGYYLDSIDADPGSGFYWLTMGNGLENVLIEKLSSAGNFIWAKQFTTLPSSVADPFTIGTAIALDNSNNVYTVGRFSGTIDFDPSISGVNTLSGLLSFYGVGFISKLDPGGNFIWAKELGEYNTFSPDLEINAIGFDGVGNVYTKGVFDITADFDPGVSNFTLTSASPGGAGLDSNLFLCKLNSAGNFLWAKNFAGDFNSDLDNSSSLKIDASGNIYTCSYASTLQKFDNTGNSIWIASGTAIYEGNSIALDGNGKVYIAGLSGNGNLVSQFDTTGNLIWTNGVYYSGFISNTYPSLALDTHGNLFFTGTYIGATTAGAGTGAITLPNNGEEDVFICKLACVTNEVWPGDVDNNSIVDNNDLLPIGLFYGQTGTARITINNIWQADACTNWGANEPNGTDIKHADCNGDGTIDNNDTLAINLNFSSTHAITSHPVNQQKILTQNIYIVSNNSYNAGDIVDAEVWLGTAANPVSSLYGIAFNINYDPTVVQTGTESITYPASWLGTPGIDAIKISKIDALAATAYGAETRINHTNATGFGKIADFKFQINNTITTATTVYLTFSGYNADNAAGAPIAFNTIIDTITINATQLGINKLTLDNYITIAPNPFTSQTTIAFSETQKNTAIKIMDIVGKEIKSVILSEGRNLTIDRGTMQAGIYFVQITDESKNVVNRKIVVQ